MLNLTEYLLTCLAEECNEVGQRATKALRFGLEEVQPGQPRNNALRIMEEYHDLQCIVEMLQARGELPTLSEMVQAAMSAAKKAKFKQFMVHARTCGALADAQASGAIT